MIPGEIFRLVVTLNFLAASSKYLLVQVDDGTQETFKQPSLYTNKSSAKPTTFNLNRKEGDMVELKYNN